MKKLFLLAMMFVFGINTIIAQPDNSDKAYWKSAQKAAKTLKKEGWKTDGVQPLEDLIFRHIKNINAPGKQEYIGSVEGATNVTTMNQAKQWAYNNAVVSYAKQSQMELQGAITGDVAASLLGDPKAQDFFYDAYMGKFQKEIKGEMTYDFSIFRNKKDGTIDYRAYYVLDEEGSRAAEQRALQGAINESDYARQHAEQILDYVRGATNK